MKPMFARRVRAPLKAGGFFRTLLALGCLLYLPLAFAQAGCVKGFLNPQDSYPHNTANASTSPLVLKPGAPLGEVSYSVPVSYTHLTLPTTPYV